MTLKPFVIDSEEMICHLFEQLWGEETYTLNSLDDAHFRVPDFGPNLILVSCDLYLAQQEKVEELFVTEIPIVLMGFSDQLKAVQDKGWEGKTLEKPLQVASLKEDLKCLLS